MRIIPKNTKVKMTFYKSVTVADVVIGFIGLVLIAIALSSNLAFKFLIAGGILVLFIPLYITFNEDVQTCRLSVSALVCSEKVQKSNQRGGNKK